MEFYGITLHKIPKNNINNFLFDSIITKMELDSTSVRNKFRMEPQGKGRRAWSQKLSHRSVG